MFLVFLTETPGTNGLADARTLNISQASMVNVIADRAIPTTLSVHMAGSRSALILAVLTTGVLEPLGTVMHPHRLCIKKNTHWAWQEPTSHCIRFKRRVGRVGANRYIGASRYLRNDTMPAK